MDPRAALHMSSAVMFMNARRNPETRDDSDARKWALGALIEGPCSAIWHLYDAGNHLYHGRINEIGTDLYKSLGMLVSTVAFPILGMSSPTRAIIAMDKLGLVEYYAPSWFVNDDIYLDKSEHAENTAKKYLAELKWVGDSGLRKERLEFYFLWIKDRFLGSEHVSEELKQEFRDAMKKYGIEEG